MTSDPTRIAILVSGGGRGAANLARACAAGEIAARLAIVVAHRVDAPAVARCRDLGLRVAVLPRGPEPDSRVDDRIDEVLEAARTDLVCLAGYLRRFRVGTRWAGRALNVHPGLLPRFGGTGMYGLRVHRAVLDAGVGESGCTVHEVDEEYDHGPAIVERRCPVLPGDDPERLAERVFAEEVIAYPEAVRRWIERGASRRTAADERLVGSGR